MCNLLDKQLDLFRDDPFGNYLWYFWKVREFSCPEDGDPVDNTQCAYNLDSREVVCQQPVYSIHPIAVERHSWSIGNCSSKNDILGFTGIYSLS